MRIILEDKYKSLHPFESDDLNDLTVITGLNGSGKSQLLDLIERKAKKHKDVSTIKIKIEPPVERIQAEGLMKVDEEMGHEQWKTIVQRKMQAFKILSPDVLRLRKFIIENGFESKVTENMKTGKKTLLSSDPIYKSLIAKLTTEITSQPLNENESRLILHERSVLHHVFNFSNDRIYEFIDELSRVTHKEVDDLKEVDFYNTPLREGLIDSNDLFSSRIELIFYNYAKRRDKNNRSFFDKEKYGDLNDAISDDEFVRKYPPPWDLVNNILTTHKIGFYFKGIERMSFTADAPMEVSLYKKTNNTAIPFNDLSSGEKIIIGLILKLFTSSFYESELSFPDLIILDEPDAFLHPEMCKLLLDVLHVTFVTKYRIKVILTTHSPSTVALAPEESIFQLTNENDTGLRKVSKDDALRLLTGFIPTLSIDYKNHKQVFVESPTDVDYYQKVYDRHQQSKALPYRLYFISNASGKGNCDQVYQIVEQIRGSGNTTSFGIVDWDLANTQKDHVLVHGLEERYSVENFILDPIYIICLLINMNNAHGICAKIGISETYNQFLIGQESSDRLQEIVKIYFGEFEQKFPACRYDTEKIAVEYLNDKRIELPIWYLRMKGHELVVKLKAIFPALNKYTSEGELQSVLSTIIAKCYPFIPATTIRIMEGI